jgi:hypothetical protein
LLLKLGLPVVMAGRDPAIHDAYPDRCATVNILVRPIVMDARAKP